MDQIVRVVLLLLLVQLPASFHCTDTLSGDNGGWGLVSSMGDEGECNIEIRDAKSITHREFIQEYAYTKPVILRGLTDNTKFRFLCSKSNLVREYGEKTVRLSTANTHSYRKVDVRFEEFVKFLLTPQSEDTLGSGRLSLILYMHTANVFHTVHDHFILCACLFQIRCTSLGTITSRSGILCLKSIKRHPFLFHACFLHIASGLLDQVLVSRFTGTAPATLKLSTAGSVGSCTPLTRHPSSTPTTPICPGSLCPTQTWSSTRGPWSAPYDPERCCIFQITGGMQL